MPTKAYQLPASHYDCLAYRDLLNNWQFSLTSPYIATGWKSLGQHSQCSGFYFNNIDIPPGSKILQAYLILRASTETGTFNSYATFKAEDNPAPSTFTTLADWQTRTWHAVIKTHEYIHEDWHKDTLYASPSLDSLIQSCIDKPGWATGSSIVLFWGDEFNRAAEIGKGDKEAYSYEGNPSEAPRLEITYTPPTPAPPPALPEPPTPLPPPRKNWALLDLKYTYLIEGFKIVAYTDVPCHLYCRMTTVEPQKHSIPSPGRASFLLGDIRFCFVVYDDNEQEEPGDTLVHTWLKLGWPYCQTRWFYFIGKAYGDTQVSETAIFKLHYDLTKPPAPLTLQALIDTAGKSFLYSTGPISTSWTALRNGINLSAVSSDYLTIDARFITTRAIAKTFLAFDLYDIAPTCHFSSLTLQLFGYLKAGNHYVYILKGYHHNPMVIEDWPTHKDDTLLLGSIYIPSINIGQYNNIVLNADGEAWFRQSCRAILKFSFRHQANVDNLSTEADGYAYFWKPTLLMPARRPLLLISNYVP